MLIEVFARKTLFAVYLCLRDRVLYTKKSPFLPLFRCLTQNLVLYLQNFENECRLDTPDILALFDLIHSITRGMMFLTTIVDSIVVSNVQYSDAEEQANPGS